ncbi:glycosyltransferase [Gemmata sp. JC717]|uniref:glycosyltransferase family 2 protein n=1 Tax=Gemmata algarum TaxID=2975278 RepID=UPI0021BB8992|nr:glycosyltransferase [Gemmata algarum]MDY3556023.1 glycosyltransferase [Gemmata algarum]
MSPRFSVVIPTRERADTLRFALRTCLDQSFDDYEVVVSDNHSSPATRSVVDETADPRVRYVRTPEPVAMSTNWEFAVGHARGEHVLLIGDDDGLLPHALGELDRLFRERAVPVIRWDAAYYTWPTVALPGQGGYLRVPLGRGTVERDAGAVIAAVAGFREFYTELPMLYNAAVRRDVLDELRTRSGRVFPHHVPDVYSGFAVAHAAGRFLSVAVPMTVSGQSRASNGIASLFNRGRTDIDREFFALNTRDGYRCEPSVPDLPVFPHAPVADAFVFAKRTLFPHLPAELDRRALAVACVAGARVAASEWPDALATVRASLADVPELVEWFDRELAGTPYHELPPPRLRPDRMGGDGDVLHLDATAFGVCDVAGAAALCEQILGYRRYGLSYYVGTSAGAAERSELQEKESQVRYLTRECAELQEQLRRQHTAFTLHIEGQDERLRVQEERLKRQDEVLAGQRLRIVGLEKQAQKGVIGRIADLIRPRRAG